MYTRKPWYEALKAVRRVARRKALFGSLEVGAEAEISPSEASAWLAKFCNWGYVRRSGAQKGPKRWRRLYALTSWGRRFRPSGGRKDEEE